MLKRREKQADGLMGTEEMLLTVETRHGLQNECPHGVVTGSQRRAKQMEHSSIDMVMVPTDSDSL